MKIWVISHYYPSPGKYSHLSLRELVKHGHSVQVFSFVPWLPKFTSITSVKKYLNEELQPFTLEGVNVIPIPYIPGISRINTSLANYIKARAAINVIKRLRKSMKFPNIIYAFDIYLNGQIGARIAAFFELPIAIIMIGTDIHTSGIRNHRIKSLIGDAMEHSDLLLSVCDALANRAIELYQQWSPQIKTLYSICDVDNYRATLPISTSLHRLLFVGALVPTKGIFELIEAFDILTNEFPDLNLTLRGSGKWENKLRSEIKHRSIESKVKILGRLDEDKLISLYNTSDIFVFPSHAEGLPNSVVEAVSCERAVVTSNVGGVSEIAADNTAFIRIPSQDVTALVEGIKRILKTDISQLRSDASANRLAVIQRFSPSVHVAQLEKYLNHII